LASLSKYGSRKIQSRSLEGRRRRRYKVMNRRKTKVKRSKKESDKIKRKITFGGKQYEIELWCSPIFKFKCPRCHKTVYEGVCNFDLELEYECDHCGYTDELWNFPHTIKGTNYWTKGAHYTNTSLVDLPLKQVLSYFFWDELPENKQPEVHG